MSWYIEVLKKYAVFSGRARRSEYWFFALFNIIIGIVLIIIDSLIGTTSEGAAIGLLTGIYSLAVLIPGLAVAVRRLHDTEKSAWALLVMLIPLIGGFIFLYFMVSDSDPGRNRYGRHPDYAEYPEAA